MKDAAIEILIYKPNPDKPVPEEQRGVAVNPRLKQRFKQFVPIGVYLEGYDLALLSTLPDKNKAKAENGIIYLSENGQYVVRDSKGVLQEGTLNTIDIDLSQLQMNLENSDLKSAILKVTSNAGHTHSEALKYYFFDECDNAPKIYSSLDELKRALPVLDNIFEKTPKLFIMGHGNGGYYGLGNCHGSSEHLYDGNFDKLLSDFNEALPTHHGEVSVTLEGCNTDSQFQAAANKQEKTFLERVSVNHPRITFGGTGPWGAQDVQTGFRSLAPEAPITSMAGNIWKAGNSVIFHHGEQQVAVRKSLFASTKTAKELKVNTIKYARAMLGKDGSDELIAKIALNRDILKIQDLKDVFLELKLEGANVSEFVEREVQILGQEQENYLTRVRDILKRADPIEQLTDRDGLVLLLGLKEPSVFNGHEDLQKSILTNQGLLKLAMVSCGKVLVGGPSNDSVIDLLIKHGADINSADKKGMTARAFHEYFLSKFM